MKTNLPMTPGFTSTALLTLGTLLIKAFHTKNLASYSPSMTTLETELICR